MGALQQDAMESSGGGRAAFILLLLLFAPGLGGELQQGPGALAPLCSLSLLSGWAQVSPVAPLHVSEGVAARERKPPACPPCPLGEAIPPPAAAEAFLIRGDPSA